MPEELPVQPTVASEVVSNGAPITTGGATTTVAQVAGAPKEQVSPRDVLNETGIQAGRSATRVALLSATQQAGLWLAGATGVPLLLVIGYVSWAVLSHPPPVPTIDPKMTTDVAEKVIKNYNSLSAAAAEVPLKLFETVAVKTLLPVFTGIIGYIFGSRTRNDSS